MSSRVHSRNNINHMSIVYNCHVKNISVNLIIFIEISKQSSNDRCRSGFWKTELAECRNLYLNPKWFAYLAFGLSIVHCLTQNLGFDLS